MSEASEGNPARRCSVDGCEEPHYARGMCSAHYRRWSKGEGKDAPKRKYVLATEFKPPEHETTLAYLAGLIDGDGSITRKAQGGNWVIEVFMTDIEVIDWLQEMGGTRAKYLQKDRTRWRYEWYLSRQAHVLPLLEGISPYLRVIAKQEKARAAIVELRRKAELRNKRRTT